VRVAETWNKLDPEIRNSETTKKFKTRLKASMKRQ
jgi:hypothetical protein